MNYSEAVLARAIRHSGAVPVQCCRRLTFALALKTLLVGIIEQVAVVVFIPVHLIGWCAIRPFHALERPFYGRRCWQFFPLPRALARLVLWRVLFVMQRHHRHDQRIAFREQRAYLPPWEKEWLETQMRVADARIAKQEWVISGLKRELKKRRVAR